MTGASNAPSRFAGFARESLAEAGKGVSERTNGRFEGRMWWIAGSGAALSACLAVCLIVWEPGMAFPAEWGRPIGSKVDEWVRWLTVNASGVFDSIKNVLTTVVVKIEDFLLWIPWPVIILAVGLAAWKISGRVMAVFAIVALVLVGMMGRLPGGTDTLWEMSMLTLALIIVSVSHLSDNRDSSRNCRFEEFAGRFIDAPGAGRHADDAQFRLPGAGHPVLRTWDRARGVGNRDIRNSPGNSAHQPGYSPGTCRGG